MASHHLHIPKHVRHDTIFGHREIVAEQWVAMRDVKSVHAEPDGVLMINLRQRSFTIGGDFRIPPEHARYIRDQLPSKKMRRTNG